ncbi:MAG: GNAT family N-acetyltransferase [Oscillospiraceae bacterium]|jgi:RimJ/RimL family protein N-acetyltransferase/predicted thioesterase|nr:GNAT family N-acetyltransferase [Oscillospiraceae bacterium]
MDGSRKTTLETARLALRAPAPDDYMAFQSWCGDPENTRYMAWGPNTEEQTKEWMAQSKPGLDFAVALKGAGTVIGSCGIYPDDANHAGTLGWILHKDYQRRGYGTELGGELIRYGFEDLKLARIQAPCAAVNRGSYRVAERCGMRREALRRKAFWARVDKEWIDELWYAILAEDYFAPRDPLAGKTASVSVIAAEADTAKARGSGSLDVYSTPAMLALMERAACECLADTLAPGQTSVGIAIAAEHTAACLPGAPVTATAEVTRISGRRVEFAVSAETAEYAIGKGTHTRVIVDGEGFMAKVNGR